MITIYQILFYRLYKLARIMRSDEDAASVAGLTLGGLIWWWIVSIIELFNLRGYLPRNSILVLLIVSGVINTFICSKESIRSKMIARVINLDFLTIYDVLAYFLFIWTILGPILIAALR